MSSDFAPRPTNNQSRTLFTRFLDWVERAGNKLPDPALLFLLLMILIWVLSALLSRVEFTEKDPRKNQEVKKYLDRLPDTAVSSLGLLASPGGLTPLQTLAAIPTITPPEDRIHIENQFSSENMSTFLVRMVGTFISFPPLGVVLVAILGVGVAEHTGFINALLKAALRVTPNHLLTPMLMVVSLASHTAGDTGYVLIIPLGGVIFAAAGRHPLAGIVCAFAGVAGGFSANFLVSPLDTLLQGLTMSAAQLVDPHYRVDVLCNYVFLATSSVLIVLIGWYITDRIIEPKLRNTPLDGDPAEMPKMGGVTSEERRGMFAGLFALFGCVGLFGLWAFLDLSFRAVALREAIVPLIFLVFIIPGTVHGYVAGTVRSHRDIVKGMTKSMNTMGYYLVMAFFAALFIYAFGNSNLGILLAVKGANFLQSLGLPAQITIVGIIILSTLVNLLIGSASAKWALLGPIFVPMLMQLGLSPELTQAAYRVGDSSTNIITPLMPYFPLIVVYCQRYVTKTGIGTLISLMLPYSMCFLFFWTLWLIVFWQLGLPLGVDTSVGYYYSPAGM